MPVVVVFILAALSLTVYSQIVLPRDKDGIEEMLQRIEHFSLSEIKNTITLIEYKSARMLGHRYLQWLDLRRRLQYEVEEREYILSRDFLSIPVPDPHVIRALTVNINPAYPKLIFEFNSGVRNGHRFNITICSDRASLNRDLGVTVPNERQGLQLGWFGTTKIESTLLFMVHPNGVGLQLFCENKGVLIADNLMNYRMAPTVEVSGYHKGTDHQHHNVIKDMYCLSPKELCLRFPAVKADWAKLRIKVAGKSLFDERGYWVPSDTYTSSATKKKANAPNPE